MNFRKPLTAASTFVAILAFCVGPASAAQKLLKKIPHAPIDASQMPGYMLDFDQVFTIESGPLQGDTIFFAMNDPEKMMNHLPEFVVAKGKVILDQKTIPTLEEGWDIAVVDAVSAEASPTGKGLRILAILTLQPISQRSADYWDQPFVFDLSADGKIDSNAELNKKLSNVKPKIKTIKALRSYLARIRS